MVYDATHRETICREAGQIITYEDLNICSSLAKQIKDYAWRAESIRSWAEGLASVSKNDGGLSGNIASDKVGEGAAALIDIADDLTRRAIAYKEHVRIVEAAIDSVPNADQQRALRLYYVQGLVWDEVADIMHYTPKWCRELRDRGLKSLGIQKQFLVVSCKKELVLQSEG